MLSPIRHTGGIYTRRTIKLPYKFIPLRTLLHELAHHFQSLEKSCGYSHGKEFIFYLNFVYDVFEDDLMDDPSKFYRPVPPKN
mgnify:CR=1 FL=1